MKNNLSLFSIFLDGHSFYSGKAIETFSSFRNNLKLLFYGYKIFQHVKDFVRNPFILKSKLSF